MSDIIDIDKVGMEALDFMEKIMDLIPIQERTKDFIKQYDRAINRFRYLSIKSAGKEPNIIKAVSRGYSDKYVCGKCGTNLHDNVASNFCWNCGTQIKWDSTRCLTGCKKANK